MSLEKIIEKIIEDAEKEARAIIDAARKKAEEELMAVEEEAKREANSVIEKAKKEAENIKNRKNARVELERRKIWSEAMDEMLSEVLDAAYSKILETKKSDLRKLLVQLILNSGAKGTELLRFSENLKKAAGKEFLSELKKEAKSSGLDADFKLDDKAAQEADIEVVGSNYVIKINLRELLEEEKAQVSAAILSRLTGGKAGA